MVKTNIQQQYDQAMQLLGIFKVQHDVFALSQVISLASGMPNDVSPIPPPAKPTIKEKLSLWLAIFDALDTEIAPDFDLADVTQLAVTPPPESGLPAGVAAASIKDPVLRKTYEESLAANDLKNQRYQYQYALSQEEERAESEAREFIATTKLPYPAQVAALKRRLKHARLKRQRLLKPVMIVSQPIPQGGPINHQ